MHTTNTTIESLKSLSLRSAEPVRAASIFDPLLPAAAALTMANLDGSPNLVPLATTYHDYFSHADTDAFRGYHATVLAPYTIYPADTADAAMPVEFTRLVYDSAQ